MGDYGDDFRANLPRSMAMNDQFLAQLRDDDELLEQLGSLAEDVFSICRSMKFMGAAHSQAFSLLMGVLMSAVHGAYDIEVPD